MPGTTEAIKIFFVAVNSKKITLFVYLIFLSSLTTNIGKLVNKYLHSWEWPLLHSYRGCFVCGIANSAKLLSQGNIVICCHVVLYSI